MNALYLACPVCGTDAVRLVTDRARPRLEPVHGARVRWSAGTAWGRCGGCGAGWKLARLGEVLPGRTPALAGVS